MPILLGGGGFFLVLFVVVIFIAATAGNDGDSSSSSTSYSGYTPTSTYSYSYSPSYTYSPTYTSSYSPSYTDTSTSPSTSSTGTDGDDYGAPESNKVYKTGRMKGVGCQAKLRSISAYRKFARSGTACLNKAWKAQLAKQGIAFRSPSVVVAQGSSTSPCGGTGNIGYVPAAFYCPTNETMYFSINSAQKQGQPHMFVTLPHEYGHHVQTLIKVDEPYNARYQKYYSDISKRTRLSRRLELQAQCFAGMFVGKNYRTMGESRNIRNAESRVGDDHLGDDPRYRTHGKYRSNRYWYWRGFDTADAGTCNTWTASPSRVA